MTFDQWFDDNYQTIDPIAKQSMRSAYYAGQSEPPSSHSMSQYGQQGSESVQQECQTAIAKQAYADRWSTKVRDARIQNEFAKRVADHAERDKGMTLSKAEVKALAVLLEPYSHG